MTDTLKKYLTTDHSTRLQTLSLSQSWQTGLAHQHLPPLVSSLLGELCAAAVLLAGTLKFNGSIVLQLQGNGPIRLIMVECTSDLKLRATAHLDDAARLPDSGNLQTLLNVGGKGRFTVLLDPSDRPEGVAAYQGIVPLEGESVAQVLEYYMRHSEQLETRLWLAADAQRCTGLLLQRMPGATDLSGQATQTEDADATWTHCQTLAETLTPAELLSNSPDTLVHKLFWQDDLLAFEPLDVHWHCPCTRERVADMLRTLGRAEVESILAEQDHIHIDCNFCGRPYDFDAVDCASLFLDETTGQQHAPGSSSIH